MSESLQPSQVDALTALSNVEASQRAMVESVHYPRGYLRWATVCAAALPLAPVYTADDAPAAAKIVFCLLFFGGAIGAGLSLQYFQRENGVRLSGFRHVRVLGWAYLIAMAALVLGIYLATNLGAPWWTGLCLTPVSGAITFAYLLRWLTEFQRESR